MDKQQNDGPRPRIFILSDQSLFVLGLESLLRREIALEVVCCEADVDQALERIRDLLPDVVIVNEANAPYGSGSVTARILREAESVKVIGLNLQNNSMCIYRREQRLVHDVQDLVEAIEQLTAI